MNHPYEIFDSTVLSPHPILQLILLRKWHPLRPYIFGLISVAFRVLKAVEFASILAVRAPDRPACSAKLMKGCETSKMILLEKYGYIGSRNGNML